VVLRVVDDHKDRRTIDDRRVRYGGDVPGLIERPLFGLGHAVSAQRRYCRSAAGARGSAATDASVRLQRPVGRRYGLTNSRGSKTGKRSASKMLSGCATFGRGWWPHILSMALFARAESTEVPTGLF